MMLTTASIRTLRKSHLYLFVIIKHVFLSFFFNIKASLTSASTFDIGPRELGFARLPGPKNKQTEKYIYDVC